MAQANGEVTQHSREVLGTHSILAGGSEVWAGHVVLLGFSLPQGTRLDDAQVSTQLRGSVHDMVIEEAMCGAVDRIF